MTGDPVVPEAGLQGIAANELSKTASRPAIELTLLSDGGQSPFAIARETAAFIAGAAKRLDLALYDVRFETDAGALVLASLLAAHQRGVVIRFLYNVDHPGPIPVPPPPETAPVVIEALPVETKPVPGIPDLMHHKFAVRDETDLWTGSTNWTDDAWSKQENVIVRVYGAPDPRARVRARVRRALEPPAGRGLGSRAAAPGERR